MIRGVLRGLYFRPGAKTTEEGADVLSEDPMSWGFCNFKTACSNRDAKTSDKLKETGLEYLKRKKCKELYKTLKIEFNDFYEVCALEFALHFENEEV